MILQNNLFFLPSSFVCSIQRKKERKKISFFMCFILQNLFQKKKQNIIYIANVISTLLFFWIKFFLLKVFIPRYFHVYLIKDKNKIFFLDIIKYFILVVFRFEKKTTIGFIFR